MIKSVLLDAQVVLKIMQHCNEALPQLVTGQLLGLDVGQTLEVTDCFPFPVRLHLDGPLGTQRLPHDRRPLIADGRQRPLASRAQRGGLLPAATARDPSRFAEPCRRRAWRQRTARTRRRVPATSSTPCGA